MRPERDNGNMAVNMVYQNQAVELILTEFDYIFGTRGPSWSFHIMAWMGRNCPPDPTKAQVVQRLYSLPVDSYGVKRISHQKIIMG